MGGGTETLVLEPTIPCRATAQGNAETLTNIAPTITAAAGMSGNNQPIIGIPIETGNEEVVYLARKLTPTECASLQGFEKDWCALVPHKDSAEYKMWGNGMAFPCMLYIMEGVQEVLTERYLKNLFGGDTSDR